MVHNTVKFAMIIITVVISLYIFKYCKNRMSKNVPPGTVKFTVLGTDWCGYTTKQRKHLDDKYGKGSHTYIDCDKDKDKCNGISAFPVTRTSDGREFKGFNKDL